MTQSRGGAKYPESNSECSGATLSAIRLSAIPELAARLSHFSIDATAQMSPTLARCTDLARKRCPSYAAPADRDQNRSGAVLTELSKTGQVSASLRADIDSVVDCIGRQISASSARREYGEWSQSRPLTGSKSDWTHI